MKRSGVILAIWTLLAAAAIGQADMPKPTPEHKKLDVFAGSWTLDGDIKSSSMGPGGKMTELQKCEWMDGDFFVICHAEAKSTSGSGTSVSFMGYSTDDKTYTYREFNSYGEFTDFKGSLDGDTWIWSGDDKMGATVMKGKFTMKMTSPMSYDFAYELSQDGTEWMLVLDGKATKAK